MIGGTVLEVCNVPNRPEVIFVNVGDRPYSFLETCGVLVENNEKSQGIEIGDSLWWQSGHCYWTPMDRRESDIKIKKVGYSGVTFDSVSEGTR